MKVQCWHIERAHEIHTIDDANRPFDNSVLKIKKKPTKNKQTNKTNKQTNKGKKATFKQTCTSVAATDTVAIAVSIKLKANVISIVNIQYYWMHK